jgi:hypothetical protein
MQNLKRLTSAIAPILLGAVAACAVLPAAADDAPASPTAPAPAPESSPAQQNYWGFGLGYVFNKIPVSMSTFNVAISDLWYSHIFGDPSEKIRVAGTLGFYGFALAIPVPKASFDLYYGKPSEDLQFKGGIGGFYDVAVAGHGGVDGEVGVVIKNRVDISFMAVPLGTDAKRSYSEFLGLKSKEEAKQDYQDMHQHYVELPYYGVKVGLRF